MLTKEKQMTVEALAKLPPEQSRGELIRGEFFSISPAGHHHGIVTIDDLLDGGKLLPGFSVSLKEIFE